MTANNQCSFKKSYTLEKGEKYHSQTHTSKVKIPFCFLMNNNKHKITNHQHNTILNSRSVSWSRRQSTSTTATTGAGKFRQGHFYSSRHTVFVFYVEVVKKGDSF